MATCECANLDWSDMDQTATHHRDCKVTTEPSVMLKDIRITASKIVSPSRLSGVWTGIASAGIIPSTTYAFRAPTPEETAAAEAETAKHEAIRRNIGEERERLISMLMTIAHNSLADAADRIAAADLLLEDIRRRLDED